MEAVVLLGGFLYLLVFGFWIMGKVDRFIDSGGFSPYWDEEEEAESSSMDLNDTPNSDLSNTKKQ